MKMVRAGSFVFALLISFVLPAKAVPVTYEIGGTVTQYGANGLPTLAGVISVGDSFIGTLTYDAGNLNNQFSYEFTVAGGAAHFSVGSSFGVFSVTDNGFGGDQIYYHDGPGGFSSDLDIPLGSFFSTFTLRDASGTALSSSTFPDPLSIADFPDEHQIYLVADNVVNPPGEPIKTFTLHADITSIRSVPDAGETGILLSTALGALMLVRRFIAPAKAGA